MTPDAFLDWYAENRARSRQLFDMLSDAAYYSRPIALRHPIVFYEGHLPAFSFNTLVKKAFGRPSIDASLEQLFARGIDPHESTGSGQALSWPSRSAVQDFAAEADARVIEALSNGELDDDSRARADATLPTPLDAAYTILEHEAMHQETLLYMWHRMPFEQKRAPLGYAPKTSGPVPRHEWIQVEGGRATLGVERSAVAFAWDNELPARVENVRDFAIERHDVTNARYLEFVEAGGYTDARWWTPEAWDWVQSAHIGHPLFWERHDGAWLWRAMFGLIELPLAWPVYVSQAEASAFARWTGARLPTEAEFQRAAFGSPHQTERRHPWGDEDPTPAHGVFDFSSWDPEAAGSHPAGRSAWGIDDLVGNGWEWTSTPFGPFPGFHAMASYPEYSADFFDGEHFVMKGASPATAKALLRPTFRNWFRSRYPYVYATFRCVK
jgi:ergothioneine biosynthesis protein EgtB